ncbi:anucleate primary sterigmata protein A-like [Teratosphaeria destructans]|uniref:Anucleate primary sterigmata protein A-like n=1 Tax=Teratosphaeria destructans TaxID=418781 RepID=A0A9W7W701_9PEZI|nr:anucleate primary sterigmata protein A-like [Teratosphaeria destructans]
MTTLANLPSGAVAATGGCDPFVGGGGGGGSGPLRYASFDTDHFSLCASNSPSHTKRALEAHLKDTDRRIQDASKLGTTLVQQRRELAARLKEVESVEHSNEVPAELQRKLSELEREYNEVGRESARAFLPKSRNVGESGMASPQLYSNSGRESPTKISTSSRRLRNQPSSRVHDIEFATEISTSLLAQVRQLQAALAEKDDELKNESSARARIESEALALAQRLKHLDENEQRYKDENWNLEMKVQELEAAHKEVSDKHDRLTQTLKSTESEKAIAQRELDELKVTHEKFDEDTTVVKRQQEADLYSLRRDVATHQTEKHMLQRKIEELTMQNTELAKAVSYRWNQHNGAADSEFVSAAEDQPEHDSTPDPSEPNSPMKGTPRHGMLESETLKSSLNHAHRMIQNLKNNIHREKTEKLELKRMLADARDEIETRRTSEAGLRANVSRKREPEGIKFKKLNRPLGARRTSTTEVLEDEPEWEDHDEVEHTPSRRGFSLSAGTAALGIGAGAATSGQGARMSEPDITDGFETAHERDTATETEAFETGHEEMSEGDGEATETEDVNHRVTSLRGLSPLASRSAGNRASFQSTASASGDEVDDIRTPVRGEQPKYKLRMFSRGSRKSRAGDIAMDSAHEPSPGLVSPTSSNGTPQPHGQSLGDELDALDDDDMDNESRAGLSMDDEQSPETTRHASLEPDTPTKGKDSAIGSTPERAMDSEHDHDISSPVVKASGSSPSAKRSSLRNSNAALLAHESVVIREPYVDSGVNTDPWEPEREPVIEKQSMRSRAGDVVGGALAGFGIGRLRKGKDSDEEEPSMAGAEFPDHGSAIPDAGVHEEREAALREREAAIAQREQHLNDLTEREALVTDREKRLAALEQREAMLAEREAHLSSMNQREEAVAQREALAADLVTREAAVKEREHKAAVIEQREAAIAEREQQIPVLQQREAAVSEQEKLLPILRHREAAIAEREKQTARLDAREALVLEREKKAANIDAREAALLAREQRTAGLDEREAALFAREQEAAKLDAREVALAEHEERLKASEQQLVARQTELSSLQPSAIVYNETAPAAKSAPDFAFSAIDSQQYSPRTEAIPGINEPRPGADLFATHELDRSKSRNLSASEAGKHADDPPAMPRVFGEARRNASEDPTLMVGEDRDPSSETQTPPRKPLGTQSVNVARGRDGTPQPAKTMSDEGSQTIVSGSDIDSMLRNKSRVPPTIDTGVSPFKGTSPKRPSFDNSAATAAAADSALFARGPRRPASAGSMRHKGAAGVPPPLPEGFTAKIAAQRAPGSSGTMGPPVMPASAYKTINRPRTPADGRPASRDGTTPRPGKQREIRGQMQTPGSASLSRKPSVSSFASELDERFNITCGDLMYPADVQPATDPRMIQAITQTMIGEYLWKYTRKAGRSETSTTRHRRFFWVHPYTRTLYWSEKDPSTAGRDMLKAKSVAIQSVRVITDDNAYPPGLHRKSIVVVTPGREIVFTAPTGQRHETWFNALSYLLLRKEQEKGEAADNFDQDDIDEFSPVGTGFSIRRSISRMTGGGDRSESRTRMSLSSYNSHTTRTSSPQRREMAGASLAERHNAAAERATARTPTPTPHLVPMGANSSTTRLAERGSVSGRLSSLASRIRPGSSQRGSFSASGRGGRASFADRYANTGDPSEIYDAAVVENDSAEDLRAVIERQERDADRLENVRACCDGQYTPTSPSTLPFALHLPSALILERRSSFAACPKAEAPEYMLPDASDTWRKRYSMLTTFTGKHDVGSLSHKGGRHASYGRHSHGHGHPRSEPTKDSLRHRRGE